MMDLLVSPLILTLTSERLIFMCLRRLPLNMFASLCPLNWFCWTSVLDQWQKSSCSLIDPILGTSERLSFEATHTRVVGGKNSRSAPPLRGSAEASGNGADSPPPCPSFSAATPYWAQGRRACEQEAGAPPQRFGNSGLRVKLGLFMATHKHDPSASTVGIATSDREVGTIQNQQSQPLCFISHESRGLKHHS